MNFATEELTMKPKQVRQGDVLLVPVTSIPDSTDIKPIGRIVLAHGEATGHAHVIEADPSIVRYRTTPEGKRFVELVKTALLKHEEHGAIQLVEGKMQQGFQVEDFGEEVRRVED